MPTEGQATTQTATSSGEFSYYVHRRAMHNRHRWALYGGLKPGISDSNGTAFMETVLRRNGSFRDCRYSLRYEEFLPQRFDGDALPQRLGQLHLAIGLFSFLFKRSLIDTMRQKSVLGRLIVR